MILRMIVHVLLCFAVRVQPTTCDKPAVAARRRNHNVPRPALHLYRQPCLPAPRPPQRNNKQSPSGQHPALWATMHQTELGRPPLPPSRNPNGITPSGGSHRPPGDDGDDPSGPLAAAARPATETATAGGDAHRDRVGGAASQPAQMTRAQQTGRRKPRRSR